MTLQMFKTSWDIALRGASHLAETFAFLLPASSQSAVLMVASYLADTLSYIIIPFNKQSRTKSNIAHICDANELRHQSILRLLQCTPDNRLGGIAESQKIKATLVAQRREFRKDKIASRFNKSNDAMLLNLVTFLLAFALAYYHKDESKENFTFKQSLSDGKAVFALAVIIGTMIQLFRENTLRQLHQHSAELINLETKLQSELQGNATLATFMQFVENYDGHIFDEETIIIARDHALAEVQKLFQPDIDKLDIEIDKQEASERKIKNDIDKLEQELVDSQTKQEIDERAMPLENMITETERQLQRLHRKLELITSELERLEHAKRAKVNERTESERPVKEYHISMIQFRENHSQFFREQFQNLHYSAVSARTALPR